MTNGSKLVATTKCRIRKAKLRDVLLASLESGPTMKYDNTHSVMQDTPTSKAPPPSRRIMPRMLHDHAYMSWCLKRKHGIFIKVEPHTAVSNALLKAQARGPRTAQGCRTISSRPLLLSWCPAGATSPASSITLVHFPDPQLPLHLKA
eukprot:CAMPEP_0172694282 /NCGR_PEP_ID=MMETSP1074-20121228/26566_1 /TAXON_ID=2916 /ORGANISM="Ceratium fusus, Strain PA161109" /LENGTH=147 /DNA_ID=CAMNT_0013514771 /DNA_START=215 /DNA_END=655 /DNA_ORIENTATION=-